MEFVALSNTVLNILAREDPLLRISFRGVFPADKLPSVPKGRRFTDAYIVNTDPAGEPGEHWLAIWTRLGVCEVFYSYGLPLSTYKNPKLQAWLAQWKEVVFSDMTIQALDSQTCGHYVLMFLKAKAHGSTFQDFLAQWNKQNLVLNDSRVAQSLKRLIKEELYQTDLSCKQANVSRGTFCYVHSQ